MKTMIDGHELDIPVAEAVNDYKCNEKQIQSLKMQFMKPWITLKNLWARWRKDAENSALIQELNELEHKAYEQYRMLPIELKKHFMEG